MRANRRYFVFFFFLVVSHNFSQTNVQGTINSNTTWSLSGSPYNITGSITIRDGATLTIESGVVVQFTTSSYITVGYSQSSKGNLIANGVSFKGLLTNDARIYFKDNSASGTLENCSFDNTYLLIENNEITISNSSFSNCVYPIVFNDGGKAILSNVDILPSNSNFGIQFHGDITSDYTLKNYNIPYYIDNLTIRNNSTLFIESNCEIYLTTSTPITVGSSSSSKGTLIASNVYWKGITSSDSRIYFKNQCGTGTLTNCIFDNTYLYIENNDAAVSNSTFKGVGYPVILKDGASINLDNVIYDTNVLYPGLCYQGTINKNLTLTKNYSPYYINGLTIRDNAVLSIEPDTKIYFPTNSGINIGYSSSSKGNFIAESVDFIGLSSSDALIQVLNNSSAQIRKCLFNNVYLNIDNSSPEIRNCRFTKDNYAIVVRNNSNPTIIYNDFYNNNTAIKNYSTSTINAINNFWGDPSGPSNTNNPSGIGQKIDGLIDFTPFSQSPFNGNILLSVIQNEIDFGENVIGSYTEKLLKLITSKGSIDLFINKIEIDNNAFTLSITPPKNLWVAQSDTVSVKIKFTPQSLTQVESNLLIYNNKQGESPAIIKLKGKGISRIFTKPETLSFGVVNLKDSRTLPLVITNRSSQTITIDSIKINSSKFTYVLGATSNILSYDETLTQQPVNYIRNFQEVTTLFSLSPNKSKEILITYKPTMRGVENATLKIYYSSNQVYEVELSGEGYAAPLLTKIVSLDIQNFPNIQLNVSVDTFYNGISSLNLSNFKVFEDGTLQSENFNVIQPGQSGNARLADIVFIMDNSGSMGDEQSAVSNNVFNFVNNLASSGVDYALGLCRYGALANSGNPIIENNGMLTSDADYFKNNLWKLNKTDGGKEPGYYAIKQTASSFNFRPGSQKIFIIITDEDPDQGGATIDEAISVCLENKITLFVLTNSNLYTKFTPITNVTNGEILDIRSDFNQILNYISTVISNNYLVQYKSSDPIAKNKNREIVITVNYKSNESSDTIYYNPASMPKIQRTDSTLILHRKAWTEGTSFKIRAVITDEIEPFVKSATLYYKPTNQSYYYNVTMTKYGADKFAASIPSSFVKSPGVDYYITATDGNITVSDPKTNPAQSPYQLAVLPNVAPKIEHNIIEAASKNTAINITAIITDTTNNLTDTKLYYRKSGQISYQSLQMNLTSLNVYSAVIPKEFVTNVDIEYYIKATDDFGLSSYHGTFDQPHKISIVALNVSAQIDTFHNGISIKNIQVPQNGTGYCYFKLTSNGTGVYSNSNVKALLISADRNINVEGKFISRGIFRLDLPGYLFVDSVMSFTLGNGITVSDTFYSFNASQFEIRIRRVPTPYQRTWTVFASGSAGVSGTIGSVGVGASASAAKLSVKGEAGAGLEIQIDQNKNLVFDRRLEASLTTEVKVPEVNLTVASATVTNTSSTIKTFFGQKFGFSQLNLEPDKIQMAQAGFLLETLSFAGAGLSPGVGAILAAIIETINATAGMLPIFNDGLIKIYTGLGIEGSVGVGFQSKFQGIEFNALNPSLGIAVGLKLNNFNSSHPSISNNSVGSVEFSEALSFNFSTLDFGLKSQHDFDLGGGNFSFFDAGLGSEVSIETKINPSFNFNGLSLSLKGGGGLNIFNASTNKYYSTQFDVPKELYPRLSNSNTKILGLYTKDRKIPLSSDLLTDVTNTIKFSYDATTPIDITTSEIRGNGYTFDLGIDLDAALGAGVGLSFGIKFKYYDELAFPRKFSKAFLGGDNYLIYTNEYSDEMNSDSVTSILRDIFSGVIPLVKQSFLNIISTMEKIIVAGKEFVIDVVSKTGDAIGTVVGTAVDTGTAIITTLGSYLPSLYQLEPFQPPKVMNMNRSTTVYHQVSNKQYELYESNLIIISDVMSISFKKNDGTILRDTLNSPFTIKMFIHPEQLQKFNLSMEDSSNIKIYYYDKKLLNWVYLGGELKDNSVIVSTNKLGEFALGIELSSISDKEAPNIIDYGPKQGAIVETYPEIFAVVQENRFGSGLDLINSKIIINGKEKEIMYDPSTSKIFYLATRDDINNNATNHVEIIVYDFAGNHSKISFDFRAVITSVADESVKYEYKLYQNYPNPFNPTTQIKFSLAEKCNVEINIYDIRGRLIKTLFKGELNAGYHNIEWNSTNNLGYNVASGVYFYQLKTEKYNVIKKMLLIR
ncbi:MAG: T9SS type A sorting domain-containing protein [Melioribacteraceae bacterium]